MSVHICMVMVFSLYIINDYVFPIAVNISQIISKLKVINLKLYYKIIWLTYNKCPVFRNVFNENAQQNVIYSKNKIIINTWKTQNRYWLNARNIRTNIRNRQKRSFILCSGDVLRQFEQWIMERNLEWKWNTAFNKI